MPAEARQKLATTSQACVKNAAPTRPSAAASAEPATCHTRSPRRSLEMPTSTITPIASR